MCITAGFEPITSCIVCGISYHCATSVHTLVMWNVQTRLMYIVFAHGDWYRFANGKGAYCVIRVSIEYILACTWFVLWWTESIHVCTVTYWYIQGYTCMYRYIPVCTGTYRYVPVHTCMYRYIPGKTKILHIHNNWTRTSDLQHTKRLVSPLRYWRTE